MRVRRIIWATYVVSLAVAFLAEGAHAAESVNQPFPDSVTWLKYQDPYEQAFSMEVPQGWTVKGGLFRMGYSDIRPMVDMTSPDGKTQIRFGDVTIPSYSLPTALHPPGDVVDLGAQAQMTSAKYHSGQQFTTAYAETYFIRVCQRLDPRPTEGEPPVKFDLPQDRSAERSTAGQVTYKCDAPGGSRIGYVYARTNLYPTFWQVTELTSFLTPSDRLIQTRNIILHCSETLRLDAKWIERQKQEDAFGLQYQQVRQRKRMQTLGQEIGRFEQQMGAMRGQVASFERGQARQAAQIKGVTDALTGITPTVDPYGNERDVWIGPYANYWRNGAGSVINSTGSPGAGWTQLTPAQ